MMEHPTVLIFRKRLLPWSETFIAAQGRALSRYRPVFVGYEHDPAGAGYLDGCERIVLADTERLPALRLGKALMKGLGRVPHRWRRALEQTRPQLLHAHFATSARPARVLARALGVPLVMTFHGHDIATTPRSRAHVRERRRVFDDVTLAIAVSEFIAEQVRAAGCPADKIRVHRIGVDTGRFAPGGASVEGRILFVGRLVAKKGLKHLLRALPAVVARVGAAELIVVGDGPLRAPLEAEASAQRLPVRFLGVQSPAQVLEHMRSAAVLASPSVVTRSGDAEGLPVTIMEALATGLPVVAFPSGGSAEGVRSGETGILVEPGDEPGLAQALVTVLSDDALRRRMAVAARRLALDSFSIVTQTPLLEDIYDEASARVSPAGSA